MKNCVLLFLNYTFLSEGYGLCGKFETIFSYTTLDCIIITDYTELYIFTNTLSFEAIIKRKGIRYWVAL